METGNIVAVSNWNPMGQFGTVYKESVGSGYFIDTSTAKANKC